MPDQKSEEQDQHGHEAIIKDSWIRARKAIRQAESTNVNPELYLFPTKDRMSNDQLAVLEAHTAIIQFRDDVYAYRNESQLDADELWNKQILEITLPEEWTQSDDGVVDITLQSIESWSNFRVQTTQETTDHNGKQTKDVIRRVLLPIDSYRPIFRRLQDFLHELGLTAPTKDTNYVDDAEPQDLIWLLTTRGQLDPLRQLPQRWFDEDITQEDMVEVAKELHQIEEADEDDDGGVPA